MTESYRPVWYWASGTYLNHLVHRRPAGSDRLPYATACGRSFDRVEPEGNHDKCKTCERKFKAFTAAAEGK